MLEIVKLTQTDYGRALEWAVGIAVSQKLMAPIIRSPFSLKAEASFAKMTDRTREVFQKSGEIAVSHILEKEKTLLAADQDKRIEFNTDSAGRDGDVRDILLYVGAKVLGISCKNNHEALKHSRLSGQCNFIKTWGIDTNGCSADYWEKVKPLFANLTKLRKDSNRTMLWEDIPEKADMYYWPVLNAWEEEIQNLCKQSAEKQAEVCKSIVSYLVGKHDFYKVICEGHTRVTVQGFNFNNSLVTKKTKYPNCIVAINNKNGGQYSKTIVFNHGYSINFRIHNASSKVEPSLKFDIKAIGLPVNDIYQQTFDIPI